MMWFCQKMGIAQFPWLIIMFQSLKPAFLRYIPMSRPLFLVEISSGTLIKETPHPSFHVPYKCPEQEIKKCSSKMFIQNQKYHIMIGFHDIPLWKTLYPINPY